MIQNVDKAKLQLSVTTATNDAKQKTFDVLNEGGAFGYDSQQEQYTADAVAAYNFATALNALTTSTFIDAKVTGVQDVGGNE